MSTPSAMRVRRPGVGTIYRWELRKLRSQKRTYLGLGAAALVPIIFAVAVAAQSGGPEDVPFGRYVHDTGLAIPLVLLLFGSIWLFPLITALVAGDIVAAEDHNGTLKTILTRSVERSQVFAAKTLAAFSYAALAILVTGTVATVAGVLASGFNPITTLSGTQVSASRGTDAGRGEPRRLPDADHRRRVHRTAVLDGVPQQRCGDRRDAHVLAAAAAADDHPGPGWSAAVPAEHAVQLVAGVVAHADRLVPDHARGLGLRAVRDSRARRGPGGVRSPRRRRRLTG